MTRLEGRGNAGQILETLMKGQTLKYLIFAVLLLNFVQYFLEEAQQASLMLTAESPLLAWTGVFVTTIDELGWIGLLLAFELETYWLSYQALSVRWVRFSLQGLRGLCYVLLAHTIVSNLSATQSYLEIDPEPEMVSPCTLADQDVFFSQNLAYQLITPDNCQALTSDEGLFLFRNQRRNGCVRLSNGGLAYLDRFARCTPVALSRLCDRAVRTTSKCRSDRRPVGVPRKHRSIWLRRADHRWPLLAGHRALPLRL